MSNNNTIQTSPEFIPSDITIDPMEQLDDDLTDIQDDSTEDLFDSPTEVDITTEEETIDIDGVEDDKGELEEPTDTNLDSLTEAALLIKYLDESGLQIYNEINKDLSFEDLAKDIPEFIDNQVGYIVEQRLKTFGEYADYIKMIDEGVPREAINPALQAQKYASLNIEDPKVTNDELYDLVKSMHLRKGLDEEYADQLAELSKSKGNLKEDAIKSVNYHREYVEHIKQSAKREYEASVESDRQKKHADYSNFVNTIKAGDVMGLNLNNKEQALVHDTVYKADQPVNYVDPNTGEQHQGYVTKYEIGLHQAANDPKKMAIIAYLIANDFNISAFKSTNKLQNNKTIIDQLEKRGQERKSNTTRSNNSNRTFSKTPFMSKEFDIT